MQGWGGKKKQKDGLKEQAVELGHSPDGLCKDQALRPQLARLAMEAKLSQ